MHEALSTTELGGGSDTIQRAEIKPFPIHTPDGLPGFDSSRRWSLETTPGAVFSMLHNLDAAGVGLMLAEPWELALGYEPDLPDEELLRIGIDDARDVQVFVVATIASDTAGTTATTTVWLNLAAPVVVNLRTHMARQVILDRQGWPMRHAVEVQS